MPTYQYQCKSCGHELEEFHSMSEPPLTHCPNCHTENLVRVMGTGVGLIFKGTGFYLTDYKKSGTSPAAGESKKDGGGTKKDGGESKKDGGESKRDSGESKRDSGESKRDSGESKKDGGEPAKPSPKD